MKTLLLYDNATSLGRVTVESDDGRLVIGDFEQFAGYLKYAELFSEYENAANDQLLVEIDRLDKIVAGIGLRATELNGTPTQVIRDVQIGSSRISFRWVVE